MTLLGKAVWPAKVDPTRSAKKSDLQLVCAFSLSSSLPVWTRKTRLTPDSNVFVCLLSRCPMSEAKILSLSTSVRTQRLHGYCDLHEYPSWIWSWIPSWQGVARTPRRSSPSILLRGLQESSGLRCELQDLQSPILSSGLVPNSLTRYVIVVLSFKFWTRYQCDSRTKSTLLAHWRLLYKRISYSALIVCECVFTNAGWPTLTGALPRSSLHFSVCGTPEFHLVILAWWKLILQSDHTISSMTWRAVITPLGSRKTWSSSRHADSFPISRRLSVIDLTAAD